MPIITYQDFDLLIQPGRANQTYTVKLLRSGAGDAEAAFSLSDLQGAGAALSITSQVPQATNAPRNFQLLNDRDDYVLSAAPPPTLEGAQDIGGRLFRAVFKEDIFAALWRSLDQARRQGARLRIRLNLTGAPELAVLPWEFLYNEKIGHFYSQFVETTIVRYLELSEPIEQLVVDGPLRVLVMVAKPSDLPQLAVEQEWNILKEALKKLEEQNLLELERLEHATVDALHERLMRHLTVKPYHIFHFIGHGAFDMREGSGELLLENDRGEARAVSGARLGALLRDNNRTIRLAVINACEGARIPKTNSYAGTAQGLLQQGGIPAVIAMQYTITDQAALTFARQFYKAVASGYPLDAAVAQARKAIYAEGNNVEWATPVLYMRAESGYLFDTKLPSGSSIPLPLTTVKSGDQHPLGKHYEAVIKAILEGKLVPFLGLDVNLYGRMPMEDWQPGQWLPSSHELAKYLAHTFSYPAGEPLDLFSVSQYAVIKKKGLGELYDCLSEIFNRGNAPTPLHLFLAQIPKLLREKRYPEIEDSARQRFVITTTNLDNLLERAFKDFNPFYHVVAYVVSGEQGGKFQHSKYAEAQLIGEPTIIDSPNTYEGLNDLNPVILKLPGAVGAFEQQFAITEDHYSDYLIYRNLSGLLPPQLRGKLKGSHHLFLGSTLRNWNLRALLYRIWEKRQPNYASWAVHPAPEEIDKDFWQASSVEIIAADFEDYIAELSARLQAIPAAGGKT